MYCVLCVIPASAAEADSQVEFVVHSQEKYLPFGGAESFCSEHTVNESNQTSDASIASTQYLKVYGFEYIKGSLFYGDWRNGASAGSTTTSMTVKTVDYEIAEAKEINPKLVAITVRCLHEGAEEYDFAYHFVGMIDDEYRVMLAAWEVPEELTEDLIRILNKML